MKVPDHVSGAILVAFSTGALILALSFPPAIGNTLGPGVFPALISTGLGICGLLLIVGSLHRRIAKPSDIQEETPDNDEPLNLRSLGMMGLMLGLPVAYIFTVQELGFLITSLILVFVSAYALWGGLLRSALFAAACAVGTDGLFRGIFGIPFDVGLLSGPW